MPRVNCLICEKEFYVKPRYLARGWGKYCSKNCQNKSQKTGTEIPCFICGKLTYKALIDQGRSKSGKFFCGKSCQTRWRNSQVFIGERHGNWAGGEASYRQALLRTNIPRVCQKCKNQDTRILAVHHKDKNRKNNHLENLTWLCHNCHYLVHHFREEAIGFVVKA